MIPGNIAISAPTLPSERAISLAHAQRCSFLIIEQCCSPLAVEKVPGKHCDYSTYLAKSAKAQSGAFAEVQFPDYGTEL
jgi:ribonuclease BN (tRNA processing enzyme)